MNLGAHDGLFALLNRGDHPRSAPEDILPFLFVVSKGGLGPETYERIGALEGRRAIPLELLPPMVRLPNTNDPKSAELFVPPGGQSPNQDLLLKAAVIEVVSSGIWPLNLVGITGTPITRGISKKLPWLADQASRSLFYRKIYEAGFSPGGSVETLALLTRG